jgi:hypothetical protein
MEMPADCSGCGDTYDLNDLWSRDDGQILCRGCKDIADNREWAYAYVDSPGTYCGPVSEHLARQKARNDLSVVVLYRDRKSDPWTEVDT